MANTLRWMMALVLSAVSLAHAAADFSLMNFLGWNRDVQVVTLTETTRAGRKLRRPSLSAPVYYCAKSLGFSHWGKVIPGDRKPDEGEAIKMIQKILANQGYLPANDEHPATLFLAFNWGTLNVNDIRIPTAGSIGSISGFKSSGGRMSGLPGVQDGLVVAEDWSNFRRGTVGDVDILGDRVVSTNRTYMSHFLLGNCTLGSSAIGDEAGMELDSGLTFVDNSRKAIHDMLGENLFIATITAFDLGALANDKKKILLWITKIGCPSIGLALDRTLATMVAVAGPNIGRETNGPVLIRASDKFKASVELSDPVVLGYIESGKTPVARSKPAVRKAR